MSTHTSIPTGKLASPRQLKFEHVEDLILSPQKLTTQILKISSQSSQLREFERKMMLKVRLGYQRFAFKKLCTR